jgi:hypothetical protein
MAKTYSVVNTTYKPAKPLILSVGTSSGGSIPGDSSIMLNTDDVPKLLSQEEYYNCKGAIARWSDAGMVKMTILDDGSSEDSSGEVDDIDDLREQAKALKVPSWHVMGKEKLEEAIAKAKEGSE